MRMKFRFIVLFSKIRHFVNKVPIKQAVQLAGEYSSLSVQFKGTQASYPFLKDLDSKFRL